MAKKARVKSRVKKLQDAGVTPHTGEAAISDGGRVLEPLGRRASIAADYEPIPTERHAEPELVAALASGEAADRLRAPEGRTAEPAQGARPEAAEGLGARDWWHGVTGELAFAGAPPKATRGER